MKYTFRLFLSVMAVLCFGFLNTVLNKVAPIVSSELAVKQLENSDSSAIISQVGISYINGSGMSDLILFLVLALIWFSPIKKLIKNTLTAALVLVATLAISNSPSQAYYNVKDFPEYIEVQPNESAFLIPLQGANKDSQGGLMSEEYLTANKVATKRIQIPHGLIRNPGWSYDYYVPSAKLIIVDRTPFNREWTKDEKRGTANKNEGFTFETADSLNVEADIVIAAFVKEEDSAKFLYWFGTVNLKPNADDPYPSVARGRSLEQVMDSVVRGKVQAVLAREFGSRKLNDAIVSKAAIISTVEKEVKEAFLAKGITIDFVGFASHLNFDNEVQVAINQVFVRNKDAEAKDAWSQMLPLYQQQAQIDVTSAVAKTAAKWNGQLPALPSFFFLPDNLVNAVAGWWNGTPTKAPATAVAK